MKQIHKTWAFALGAGLLLFLHFYRLADWPGLHFDEAWAMNYAWKIASAPGFLPLSAMSPYTAPWAHYWAALWFKVLGPSLAVFRASQISLAVAGLALLGGALPRNLRWAFPGAVLLVPGLLVNHRFAIELTGLHVFAFGAFCFALRREWFGAALAAALLGTTAHILFYGVVLGLLGAVFLEGAAMPRAARRAGAFYFGLMALFFARVFWEIPEKGKALALVLSSVGMLAFFLARREPWAAWRSPRWRRIAAVVAAVFGANALFFAQGFWGSAVFTGDPAWAHPLLYAGLCVAVTALAYSLWQGAARAPNFLRWWFCLGIFCLGAMMLKPAPRYFELAFLAGAALLAWYYGAEPEEAREEKLRPWLAVLLALNLALVVACAQRNPVSSPLRFLFYKDSSRDFLDKQSLVRFLGGSGCTLSDIHTNDPRLLETLRALSLGDWPVSPGPPCPWNFATTHEESLGVGEPWGEFQLRRK